MTGSHLVFRNTADEMGLYIFRLRLRGVVHIPANVQVVIVFFDDFGRIDQTAVFGKFPLMGENGVYLLDIFRAKFILILAFGEFPVGVDEEYLVAQMIGLVFVAHQHAGRDAGTIKQALRQADNGLDHVIIYEDFPDQFFLTTPKQHPMGHDGRHVTIPLKAGQHVLHEHEVGFFTGFGTPFPEAMGKLNAGAAVVLRKRRIGEYPVEFSNLPIFQNLRVLQGIAVFNGKTADVMKDHIHVADGPDRAIGILTIQGQVVGVLALLFHILVCLNQKTPGADSRVINRVPGLGFYELDQQSDNLGGRIKFAALFTSTVGKILDQVFIRRAEQIRELEVVVHQDKARLVEVIEQILPLLVGDLGLSLDFVEIDIVLEYACKRIVLILDGGNGFVQHIADIML